MIFRHLNTTSYDMNCITLVYSASIGQASFVPLDMLIRLCISLWSCIATSSHSFFLFLATTLFAFGITVADSVLITYANTLFASCRDTPGPQQIRCPHAIISESDVNVVPEKKSASTLRKPCLYTQLQNSLHRRHGLW